MADIRVSINKQNRETIRSVLTNTQGPRGYTGSMGRIEEVTNTLYVSPDGQDYFDDGSPNPGTYVDRPLQTIRRAAVLAQQGTSIRLYSGTYTEITPIQFRPNVSVIGDNLRTVTVEPAAGYEENNTFLLDNACYCWGITFRGHRVDDVDNATTGFAVAFAPNAFIVTSPYVQNCSSITNLDNSYKPLDPFGVPPNAAVGRGGGGMLVDSNVLNPNSPLASMVLDAFTQVNMNGIGVQIMNEGFVQLVSFFTNFSRHGVKCINGGHAVLLNSNTSFGDYGLYSIGRRYYVLPQFNFGYDEKLCRRDIGYIVTALNYDIAFGGNYNTTTSALAYYRATASAVIGDQLTETLDALNFVKTESEKFLTGTALTRSGTLWANLLNIIENGTGVADPITYPAPTGSSASLGYAKTRITNNRAFFQDEVVRYVKATYPSFTFNEALCSRDVGYIVDGVIHDMMYGGNYASRIIADSYWNGTSSKINGQQTETAAAIERLKSIISDTILGNVVTPSPGVVQTQNLTGSNGTSTETTLTNSLLAGIKAGILDISNIPTLVAPSKTWVDDTIETETNAMQAALLAIQNSTILYTTQKYPLVNAGGYTVAANAVSGAKETIKTYVWNQLVANTDIPASMETKTKRDTGYIIDAIADDLLSGGTNRCSVIAQNFFKNGYLIINDALIDYFSKSYDYIRTKIADVIVNTPSYEANSDVAAKALIQGIKNNIVNSTSVISAKSNSGTSVFNPGGYSNASSTLISSLTNIKNNVWANLVTATGISNTHETKTKRDTGFIVTAIANDLKYGGMSKTGTTTQKFFTYDGSALVVNTAVVPISTYATSYDLIKNEIVLTLNSSANTEANSLNVANSLINGVKATINNQSLATNIYWEEFGSLIVATGQDFSYAGSGVNFNALPPNQGGRGVSNIAMKIVTIDGGRVFQSSGDETGDLTLGSDFVIRQETGIIEGRTFNRSLYAILTPYILALQE